VRRPHRKQPGAVTHLTAQGPPRIRDAQGDGTGPRRQRHLPRRGHNQARWWERRSLGGPEAHRKKHPPAQWPETAPPAIGRRVHSLCAASELAEPLVTPRPERWRLDCRCSRHHLLSPRRAGLILTAGSVARKEKRRGVLRAAGGVGRVAHSGQNPKKTGPSRGAPRPQGCSAASDRMASVMSDSCGTEASSRASARPMPGTNLPASNRGGACSR
jgi:hypothetical protein